LLLLLHKRSVVGNKLQVCNAVIDTAQQLQVSAWETWEPALSSSHPLLLLMCQQ
jgi:hypothetical protein